MMDMCVCLCGWWCYIDLVKAKVKSIGSVSTM